MWEQAKALQEGTEIVVCTPVRASLHHLTYIVPSIAINVKSVVFLAILLLL